MALNIWIGVVRALKVREQDIIKDKKLNYARQWVEPVNDVVYFWSLYCAKQTN